MAVDVWIHNCRQAIMISWSSLQSESKSCCKKLFVWSIYEKHNPLDPSWLLTQHFTRHFILVPFKWLSPHWQRKALASSQEFICLQKRLLPHTTFKFAQGNVSWLDCPIAVQFISGASLCNSTWFPSNFRKATNSCQSAVKPQLSFTANHALTYLVW